MIRSMTAFAREEIVAPWGSAVWEVRTVNNRYLDVNTRLPEEFRGLESTVREHVSARLGRGKVDCTLRYHPHASAAREIKINATLVEQLRDAAGQIDQILQSETSLRALDVLRWPGVVEAETPDVDAMSGEIVDTLDQVLDEVVGMRGREGEKIKTLIEERCTQIEAIRAEVSEALPTIQSSMRERIRERLQEVSEQLAEERLEQEMVIFANRMDVAEELDRLGAHVSEVRRMLGEKKPTGRRLDFLMQELNREANTLGSKSVDTSMTRASVDLKVFIEQMREQIQNIE